MSKLVGMRKVSGARIVRLLFIAKQDICCLGCGYSYYANNFLEIICHI